MIIWINGAFGAGKTTCAYELQKRLPDSFVYDPEKVGYFIQETIHCNLRKCDFTDHKPWRTFNYEMLKYLSISYHGIILAPMTLINKAHYDEIVGRLLAEGFHIKHFILYANKETLKRRLNKRLDGPNSRAKSQIDRCLHFFDNEITEERIMTDEKNIDQVVEELALRCDLDLVRDKRSRFKKVVDRWMIWAKHIRFKA